jgi:CMP-N,N'-diacetyllegionaminic acid synthase
MNTLFVITARAGSKRLTSKNTRDLVGKPLIQYSIEYARNFTTDDNICLTTDDKVVIDIAKSLQLEVPFVRPDVLAQDSTSSRDVIVHALRFYATKGINYDMVVLLQPTSPFRKHIFLEEAMKSYTNEIDMVVSVCKSKENPDQNSFVEDGQGYLSKTVLPFSKLENIPVTYKYNGSLYIINTASILEKDISLFDRVVKYEMPQEYSVDIDTQMDWDWCEFLIQQGIVKL